MPIEHEKDSVIFEGGELRGMDGFKVQSCFNEKASTAATFVYSTGVNKRKLFSC